MTQTTTLINISTDTWQTLVNKVNELANLASNTMVTANTNANGSVTTGNAYGNGIFTYTTLTAVTALRGGNVQATAVLPITSNVSIGNSTVNTYFTETIAKTDTLVANVALRGGNLGTPALLTVSSNVIISTGNNLSVGNSTVNVNLTETTVVVGGNTTLNSTSVFIGNTTANAYLTGTSFALNGTNGPNLNTTAFSLGNTVITGGITSIGNSTVNTVANSTAFLTGSITGNGVINFSGSTDAVQIPAGTTAQRPSGAVGKLRYNTTDSIVEMYVGGTWDNVITTAAQLKVYDSANSQVFP